jgi:hypothetical protein
MAEYEYRLEKKWKNLWEKFQKTFVSRNNPSTCVDARNCRRRICAKQVNFRAVFDAFQARSCNKPESAHWNGPADDGGYGNPGRLA